MNMKKLGSFAAGVLFGTAGLKILGSEDAKKVYAKERRSLKNHLNQQFEVTRPNEVWVSDVTYFLCKDIKYYICAIIYLYARRIVGYRVGKRNST